MSAVRKRVRVKGRVQGVGFRYFTQESAVRIGVSGFVRNLPDGDVELEAEGEPQKVNALVDAVRRGPSMSRVTDVQVTDRPVSGDTSGFRITH